MEGAGRSEIGVAISDVSLGSVKIFIWSPLHTKQHYRQSL